MLLLQRLDKRNDCFSDLLGVFSFYMNADRLAFFEASAKEAENALGICFPFAAGHRNFIGKAFAKRTELGSGPRVQSRWVLNNGFLFKHGSKPPESENNDF